ncbi:MAG: SAM-dependent methyltransferase [Bacteroidetes bacterium]|nr:SAM-dependent methyltransferase [Bacteroidota bacterium]
MDISKLDSAYWNNRYSTTETGWDIGYPSTPIVEFINTISNKHCSILIPGAGNSYEGEYLITQGFTNITILDFAPEAITNFKKRVANYDKAKLVCEDFFAHKGQYDLIIEQTFFCALPPIMRKDYVTKMHELLSDKGQLAGLLFNEPNLTPNPPPFGGTKEEYEKIFSPLFHINQMTSCQNSIKPRAGKELFFTLSKK